MNDCESLLQQVIAEAKDLGIPVAESIQPQVEINRRAVARFGCCRYRTGGFVIEVAERVALGPEAACRETLAHEVLHTCWGCRNHGKRWKAYAARMNEAYGYHISRVSTSTDLGVEEPRQARYVLRCEACGVELQRFRASRLTEHPERYRCRCGGRLVRVK